MLLDRVEKVLAYAFGGLHHATGPIKDYGHTVEVSVYAGSHIATTDGDILTALVIASHAYSVRMGIWPSGPRRLKFVFSLRDRLWIEGETGNTAHPTMAQAMARAVQGTKRRWPLREDMTGDE